MRVGACDGRDAMDSGNIPKLRAIPIFADLDDDALGRIAVVAAEFEAAAGTDAEI